MTRKRIEIAAPKRTSPVLRKIARKVLRAEGVKKGVNIILGDDETLADLNSRFKGRDGPTDVLAFHFDEDDFLGEVYVSRDRAIEQAREFGVDVEEEIKRLVVHGILHLLGYSHEEMSEMTERYLK